MQILLRAHDVRSQLKRLHKSLSSLISYRMILATMLQENIQIREAGKQDRTQELRKTWEKKSMLYQQLPKIFLWPYSLTIHGA